MILKQEKYQKTKAGIYINIPYHQVSSQNQPSIRLKTTELRPQTNEGKKTITELIQISQTILTTAK